MSFEPTPQALDLLKKRYFRRDDDGVVTEDWNSMCHRIAYALAEDNHETQAFFNILNSAQFLPGTPTLVNAGKPDGQFSSCFVLPVGDSIPEIFDSIKHTALVHKSGGGTGFNFSGLRPEGSVVGSTKGVSSGPISFMRIFNAATQEMKQGGVRRGANMGILNVDHPDIVKFIKCKDIDGDMSNFNISVGVTNYFMEQLRNDSNRAWECEFGGATYWIHKDPNKHNQWTDGEDCAPDTPLFSAQDIWDLIVHQAHKNGEPGIIFVDRLGVGINATNPCVTGDTLLLTSKGYKPIGSLAGQEVWAWNGERWSEVIPRVTGENKEILAIGISDGTTIKCTPEHTFILSNNERIEAKDLEVGNKLAKPKLPKIIRSILHRYGRELAYTAGFFAGDGSIETTRDRKGIWLYGEKKGLLQYLSHEHANKCDRDRIFAVVNPQLFDGGRYYDTWLTKDFVPGPEMHEEDCMDWLAGLIDSDGTLNDPSGSISISSINRDFLYRTKLMLSTFGVWSSVTPMKEACRKLMPDGRGGLKEYECKDCYRLLISAANVRSLNWHGMTTHRVPCKPKPDRDAARFPQIVNIERQAELEPRVYCATEPHNHQLCFSSIITGNCGEQPLRDYEACNLGDIDISKFYDESTHNINWNQLQDVIEIAVVFMNRILDKSTFPLPQITEAVQKSRKIGIGVMGWADLLLKKGIRYGSTESTEYARQVMQFIKLQATAYSDENSFNNETITCIAPTGSRCILANCSSGIEPNFDWEVKHNREDFGETITYHPLIKKWDRGWQEHLPDHWVTSAQVPPEEHVAMQAAFQEFTDAGVSKTINMSNNATEDDVCHAYELAYEKGCKGVTVYRDGCRKGQVLTKAKKPEKAPMPSGDTEDRPYRLSGDTYKIQVDLGGQIVNLYVNVTKNEGKPYEVFTQGILRDIDESTAQSLDIITRLSSLALRTGASTKSLVSQLEKVNGGHLYSLPHKIANILREYLEQEDQGGCPECNAKVVFAEGCMKCTSCGWAKCG